MIGSAERKRSERKEGVKGHPRSHLLVGHNRPYIAVIRRECCKPESNVELIEDARVAPKSWCMGIDLGEGVNRMILEALIHIPRA